MRGDDADLLALLAEAESTVERLHAELAARRRARAEVDPQLSEDEFADYLAQATVNWRAVSEFLRSAIQENRRLDRPGGRAS